MVDRLVAVDDADYRLPNPVLAALSADVADPDTGIGGTLDKVFGGTVSVKDPRFGAVGDGVADDTAAIQSAIDHAYALGGAVVVVPPGVYMIAADAGTSVYNDLGGLEMRSGVTLQVGAGATLRAMPVSTPVSKIVRIIDCTDVTITGAGVIDGNRANATVTTGEWGYGVSINGGSNIRVEGIQAINCWGDGINLQRKSHTDFAAPQNVTVSRVVCHNNRRQGISIESGWHVLVANSVFSGTNGALPTAGIDIEPPDANGKIDFVTVRDNKIRGNDRMGIAVWESTKINNVIIENNELDGNGALDGTAQLRVVVGGRGFTARNNTFQNTTGAVAATIAGPAYAGRIEKNTLDKDLIVTGTPIITGFPRDMIITGNTVIGGSIRVSYMMSFAVENNYVRPPAGQPCLDFTSTAAAVIYGTVQRNTFEGGLNGILWNQTLPATFMVVDRNVFLHQTGHAMRLKGGDHIDITGNTFEGCCLETGDSVVVDLADGGGAVRRRIERNTFKKDPRSGTTATNVPLSAYKCEAALQSSKMANNIIQGASFTAFPADQATSGGTILAASGEIPSRATSYRPVNPQTGQPFFDTTLGKPIWFRNTAWVDSAGSVVT